MRMNELKKEEVLISETQTDVEDNNELDDTSTDNVISKSTRIKYAILGLSYFIAILLSNIALLFKPLYKRVYYGQANGHFRYGIGILILIALICVIKKVIQPKLGLNPIKDKRPFTWKKTLFIFGLTYLVIFIISAIVGFEIKPFHDIGNNTTGYKIGVYATTLAYQFLCVIIAVFMIDAFQYALDDIIPFKNKKVSAYIPYGGIATMLTYGIYALVNGHGGTLSVMYFFLVILYGEIYLLCNRNLLKTIASVGLIFVL
jgi:uncharacterized membrane protein YhaH (DUF805 family)